MIDLVCFLACATALGTLTAMAQHKAYPRAPAASREIAVRNGKKFARFSDVNVPSSGRPRHQFLFWMLDTAIEAKHRTRGCSTFPWWLSVA